MSFSHICARVISQGHNLCQLNYLSLKEVKIVYFNNNFKARLQTVTYISYIWNYLDQGQIYKLKNITYSS